ncbi:TfoX/Sxy family transcriptional regulator of competence genes [Isoptericola jiangsuensis]|uniref:TfoX/Sxy family transcriptional regulator of competence genes n=1 Tax=Isoptericola jiangsuensis TaxID=548579 RepID=A0A2A9EXD6_9MICO|nr:TfoX/Sxy family protein [Isoptericola jiangsuensis]PFG43548.1 TfoX/Sxy family transcriptional regulator of competence genes [Isoptericola jiangsuensis]
MAFDEELAARVRDAVGEHAAYDEKRMFGGVAFLVNTHMAVGITRDVLMVRVGVDGHDAALADGAHEITMGERTMHGTVGVDAATTADDDALHAWVARGVERALALDPKR